MNLLKALLILIGAFLFYIGSYLIAGIIFIVAFMMKDAPQTMPMPQGDASPEFTTTYNAPYRISKEMSIDLRHDEEIEKPHWQQASEAWVGGIASLVGYQFGKLLTRRKRKF